MNTEKTYTPEEERIVLSMVAALERAGISAHKLSYHDAFPTFLTGLFQGMFSEEEVVWMSGNLNKDGKYSLTLSHSLLKGSIRRN